MEVNRAGGRTEILFSFYGLVVLRVRAPVSTIRFLRSEWRSFEIDGTDKEPDIDAFLASTLGPKSRFRSSSDGVNLGGWYKGCFWTTNLGEEDGRLSVRYRSAPRSNILFKDSCLEPLVLARLRESGLSALHASSFSIGERAWSLCGPSGSGKTMLALISAAKGQTLLSDDVTIFGGDRIFPYLVPPRVYFYHNRDRSAYRDLFERWLPRNSISDLLVIVAAMAGVRIPTRIGIPEKSPISLPARQSYTVGGFFLLRPGASPGEPRVSTLRNAGVVIREVLAGLPVHGTSLITRAVRANNTTTERDESGRSSVKMLVNQGRCFEVRLPRRMRIEDWKNVHEKIVESAEGLD